MAKSPSLAPIHIYDAIERIETLICNVSIEDLESDWVKRAAAERMMSILSEASRRLKPEWKTRFPKMPWSRIAGFGSVLRHDYDDLDVTVFLKLYNEGHLQQLRRAVETLLDAVEPDWRRLREERRRRWP